MVPVVFLSGRLSPSSSSSSSCNCRWVAGGGNGRDGPKSVINGQRNDGQRHGPGRRPDPFFFEQKKQQQAPSRPSHLPFQIGRPSHYYSGSKMFFVLPKREMLLNRWTNPFPYDCIELNRVLPTFNRVELGIIFLLIWPNWSRLCDVLLGFHKFFWVFYGPGWVVMGFIEPYLVLPNSTEFYWFFTGFYWFFT